MRSQLDVRLGVLEPQIVHLPPDVVSLAAAEEAIELADFYGVADGHPLDESQRFTLRAALGERADGSWAAATVGDFEPRQNGKNDTLAARELAGLILFGERLIIHTAHEFPTANESFLRMVAVFEGSDDLMSKVAQIRYANGEQGITLKSGQRLKYRARTGGSGRGFAKADLVVYDEAQHLRAEHVAASGPARLANPNTQSWYMGSGGFATSVNAWRMRRRALAGEGGRFAYVEHTAEIVSMEDGRVVSVHPDPLDRDAWARANPAYGRRITDESLMSVYDELGPELFSQECLCLWVPDPAVETTGAFPNWSALVGPTPERGRDVVFALDVPADQSSASIAAAWSSPDGSWVQLADHRPGVEWVPARVSELLDTWGGRVTVQASGTAGFLIPLLDEARTEKVSRQTFVDSCATLDAAVTARTVRHGNQPELNAAVAVARWAMSGDSRLLSRKDSRVSPLVAAALALHALSIVPASGGGWVMAL